MLVPDGRGRRRVADDVHFNDFWFTVCPTYCRERKHWALRPQKPLRLIRDGEVGGSRIFISNTYSLHCYHQNDSALRWAVV